MIYAGYYNGETGPLEEMKIPMMDRAVYFGDGCYDATTFTNNRIFAEKDHFDRFYNACRHLEIPFAMPREALHDALQSIIDMCELDQGLLYWQVSRGTYYRGHQFPPSSVTPNLMAFTTPCEMTPFTESFSLISKEDLRYYMCNVKTLNLLPSVLAYEACTRKGCQETVFYRDAFGQKRVTECAHSNILILKDGALVTPPADNLILPGITRKHLLMLAKENGIPVKEIPFTIDELKNADEIIISSSGDLCIPSYELDGEKIGGKDPATLKILQDAYEQYYKKDVGLL